MVGFEKFLLFFLVIIGTTTVLFCGADKPKPPPWTREVPGDGPSNNIGQLLQQLIMSPSSANGNDIGQRILDLAIETSRKTGVLNKLPPAVGQVVTCGASSRDLACKLLQMATTNFTSSKLAMIPSLASIIFNNTSSNNNNSVPPTSSSPLITIAMMCSLGSSDRGVCISDDLMRRLINVSNTTKTMIIVDTFLLPPKQNNNNQPQPQTQQKEGVDLICRRKEGRGGDDNCQTIANHCRQAGNMTAVLLSKQRRKVERREAIGSGNFLSPTSSLVQAVSQVMDAKGIKKPGSLLDEATLLAQLGIDKVRCQIKTPGSNSDEDDDNDDSDEEDLVKRLRSTTELPLPPFIRASTLPSLPITLALPTIPPIIANSLTLENLELPSILNAVNSHYASLEADLRVVFQQIRQTPASGPAGTVPPGYAAQVRQVMHKAWKNRLVLRFKAPPSSNLVIGNNSKLTTANPPQVQTPNNYGRLPTPPDFGLEPGGLKPISNGPGRRPLDWGKIWNQWSSQLVSSSNSFVENLPSILNDFLSGGTTSDNKQEIKLSDILKIRIPRQTSITYYPTACSYDVMRAACALLEQNNNGTAFLLPWVLEDLFTGVRTSSTAQSSTPLATAISLCSGQQATTYYGAKVCPSQAVLQSSAQVASLAYTYYATPTYISSFVGNPSYIRSGKPSQTHFSGAAVDFLCGPYVYNPPADDSCPRLSGNCYKTLLRNAFFPAQDPNMGCGNFTVLPITATHCST